MGHPDSTTCPPPGKVPKPISWQVKKHTCSGSSRRIHSRRACSTARTAPSRGAKRRVVSSPLNTQSGRAKRPRRMTTTTLDPATEEELWIQSRSWRRPEKKSILGVDDMYCSSQIPPIWGSKRARSALSDITTQIPVWGAERARSGLSGPLLPVQPDKWRDWTDLGDGPAGLIAESLLASDVADYLSFRSVCRPWQLCSADPRKHGILDRRFHPRQWIMLQESAATRPDRRRFMNISTGYCTYVDLPELRGHDIFRTTEGLLVLLDRATCVVRLLNPFTRQAAELPPATTLLSQRQLELSYPRWKLLDVTGAGFADESTIAVSFGRIQTLAVVKPGDAHWIVVDSGTSICPALSFAGRFVCATSNAVMVLETGVDHHPPRLAMVAKFTNPLSQMMIDTVHMVDNDGELILVDRRRRMVDGDAIRKYSVFRVDLDARKIVPVHGLAGRAMFIGMKRALSVSPSVFPSISADSIYLGFDDLMSGVLDNRSPVNLLDGTSEPRESEDFDDSNYGPQAIDDYLSWIVTG